MQTQEELADQKQLFETLFHASPEAITILDEDARFVDCNDNALNMFGVATKQEFLQLTPAELSPQYQPNGESSLQMQNGYIQRAIEAKKVSFEWQHLRKNAQMFDAKVG